MPPTNPSAGVLAIRSATSRRRRCAAMTSGPYSINEPSSTRSATFSRAVLRLRRRRFATASGRAASSPPSCRPITSVRSGRSSPIGSDATEETSGGGNTSPSAEATAGPSVTNTSPGDNVDPSAATTTSTTPSAGAKTSWCIFIDSTSATTPPARTESPVPTSNTTNVPCNSVETSILMQSV